MTLAPDPFAMALWAEFDAKKTRRNTQPPPARADGSPTFDGEVKEVTDPIAYARTALERTVAELSALGADRPDEGAGRNAALNDAAFALGRYVAAGLLDETDVTERLLDACEANTLMSWTGAAACEATIRSGMTAGMRQPFAYTISEAHPKAAPFLPASMSTTWTEPPSTGWQPVDLTPYLEGDEGERPSLLARTDGQRALYAGRVHWLSGEPEALKSWLALLAVRQVLEDGGRAVYVDLEDGPRGIAGRLLAMTVDRDVLLERFTYLAPNGPLTEAGRESLRDLVAAADLLVIDACTEALALQGLSSKDDTDVAAWLGLLPRWAAQLGPAVVVLDHVVKSSENQGRWATGSQHKLAGLDGVAYGLEAVQRGGVGNVGRSRVVVHKDRHGHVRPSTVQAAGGRAWFGDLVVDSTGPFTDVALQPPSSHAEPFRPTAVMTKVASALTGAAMPLSKRAVEERVGGRAGVARQALAALIDGGFVEVENGPHNSQLHRLVKPYPPEDS